MGWIDAISRGRREGRLPRFFSTGHATPLGCDITPLPVTHHHDEEPPQLPWRIQALVDAGLSLDAANGIEVCEVGLIAAEVSEGSFAPVGPHVATVLADPEVFEGARVHCTEPHRESHWRTLAAVMPEPARSRCLELAIVCRQAA